MSRDRLNGVPPQGNGGRSSCEDSRRADLGHRGRPRREELQNVTLLQSSGHFPRGFEAGARATPRQMAARRLLRRSNSNSTSGSVR